MLLKEIVPEYYSKNILVRNLFSKRLKLVIQLAFEKLKSDNNLKVVDLGCGDGTFLKLLEEKFPYVETFGIDILPEVAETKQFLRAEIKIGDLRNSGFPNNFFDVVFCLDTLEHFKDLEQPVKEIKRILKKDGLLVISAPTENFLYKLGRLLLKGTISMEKGPGASPHFHDAAEIENFLLSNGFKLRGKKYLPSVPFLTFFKIMSFRKNNALKI